MPQADAKGSTRNILASLALCLRQHCQFLTLDFFLYNNFCEKKLIKKRGLPSMPNNKLSKNVYIEKNPIRILVDHDVE